MSGIRVWIMNYKATSASLVSAFPHLVWSGESGDRDPQSECMQDERRKCKQEEEAVDLCLTSQRVVRRGSEQ